MCLGRGSIHTLRVERSFIGEAFKLRPNDEKVMILFLRFVVLPCHSTLEGERKCLFVVCTGPITDTTIMRNNIVPCMPLKICEQVISVYYLPDFRDQRNKDFIALFSLSHSSQSV